MRVLCGKGITNSLLLRNLTSRNVIRSLGGRGKEAGVSLLLSQATIKLAAVRTSKVEYFNFERSKGIMLTPLSKSKTFTLNRPSSSSML